MNPPVLRQQKIIRDRIDMAQAKGVLSQCLEWREAKNITLDVFIIRMTHHAMTQALIKHDLFHNVERLCKRQPQRMQPVQGLHANTHIRLYLWSARPHIWKELRDLVSLFWGNRHDVFAHTKRGNASICFCFTRTVKQLFRSYAIQPNDIRFTVHLASKRIVRHPLLQRKHRRHIHVLVKHILHDS